MARILAIDYGMKRTGIAVTDPLQIIASALTTIESAKIFTFLVEYIKKEAVELILIGDPRNLDDSPTDISDDVHRVIKILQKKFPEIPVKTVSPVDAVWSTKVILASTLTCGAMPILPTRS